jgi:gluconate 2-dehydrogenase subunit 3-like protein
MPLAIDPGIFRAIVTTVVPESAELDSQGWRDLDLVVAVLLHDRPENLQAQLRLFLRLIQWLPVLRYGQPFTSLNEAARTRVLSYLQNHPIEKVRVGFWGLRTLVLAGYYALPEAARSIGYAASPLGWEALR